MVLGVRIRIVTIPGIFDGCVTGVGVTHGFWVFFKVQNCPVASQLSADQTHDGDGLGVGVIVGVGEKDCVGDELGVWLEDGVTEGVVDGVADLEGLIDGVTDGVLDDVIDGFIEGVGVLEGDGEDDGDTQLIT